MEQHKRGQNWTTRELSAASGYAQAYIRQLILGGKLRAEKFGRDWVIPDAEARRLLDEAKQR